MERQRQLGWKVCIGYRPGTKHQHSEYVDIGENVETDLCNSIECKTRGNMTGPSELVKALQDPEASASVDPRSCLFRVFVTMKTTDERYAEKLNAGMWVGSCLWKGLEVIYEYVCQLYRR